MFENNPLDKDIHSQKVIKRYEQARTDKKIQEYKLNKGLNKIKDVNIIREDTNLLPAMKNSLEKKTNKDTFEHLINEASKKKKKQKKNIYHKDYENTLQNEFSSPVTTNRANNNQTPLIVFDVNISDNKQEQLKIFNLSTAIDSTNEFCEKYNLTQEKRDFLYKLINKKIDSNELNI
jgi:hypothetical protein